MTGAARVSLVLLAFLMLGPLTAGCGKWGRPRAGDRPARQARSRRAEGQLERRGRFGRGRGGATADTSLRKAPRTKPAPGPYDGHWQGSTSQGKPLSFTVEQNDVTDLTVGIVARGCSTSLEVKNGPETREMITIANRKFTYSSPGYEALGKALESVGEGLQAIIEAEKAISGRFTTETTAAGTLKLKDYATGKVMVQATWTAVRRPQPQPSQKPSPRP